MESGAVRVSCEKCSDWKNCLGFDYYKPSEIIPCPLQVKWLLENYDSIDRGEWPTDGLSSQGGHSGSGRAPYTKPAETAVELWRRVQSIDAYSDDAELAIDVLIKKYEITSLARLMKVPVQRLESRINRVLRYCSGKNPKEKNYKEWCQHRQFRAKK